MRDNPAWKQVYGSAKMGAGDSPFFAKTLEKSAAWLAHDLDIGIGAKHENCDRCDKLAAWAEQRRQERAKDAARIKEIAAFFRQHGREDDAAYIESLPSWEDME